MFLPLSLSLPFSLSPSLSHLEFYLFVWKTLSSVQPLPYSPDPHPSVIIVGELLSAIFLLGFGFRRIQIIKLTNSELNTHWTLQTYLPPHDKGRASFWAAPAEMLWEQLLLEVGTGDSYFFKACINPFAIKQERDVHRHSIAFRGGGCEVGGDMSLLPEIEFQFWCAAPA